ncbi:MAG: energy-coupling factor transporter transmembrane protein EcfT [Ruminococcaceae bacterium]|nr:energy-coupling factor transporter transmembrane protein EcfT [Oscillospiraceae bacterium]
MNDITIGQYFPGNSLLHKIDARMKIVLLLLLMVSVFICNNYISLASAAVLTLILVLISKIKPSVILKGIKPIFFVIILTSFLNIFYASGEPIAEFWIFKITKEGLNNALFMGTRIVLLVIIGLMLTYTTTPNSLTDAIESLLKPLKIFKADIHSLAMVMTIALRFIPILIEEVQKIMAAQKSRGADLQSGGIIKRAKAIVPILIPLFVSSFRRANELADAMECRCYRGSEGRTKMKVMHLKLRDYLSMIFVILYFTGIILTRVLMENVI